MLKELITVCLCLLAMPGHAVESAQWQCVIDASLTLARDPVLQQSLRAHNEKTPDPHLTEAQWPDLTPDSPLLSKLIKHPTAALIHRLIRKYSIQGEGFLIGRDGGLVAATNKTSDYYQGDEAQFTETLHMGRGEVWHQTHLVDESANALLVKIAVPVFLPEQETAAGVLVIGLDEFVLDVLEGCETGSGK